MNTLSLYNGISALMLAFRRAGVIIDNAYIAEIDKYANAVTAQHFPDAINLGDVTKWREWQIDWSSIDFVGAGFPCQAWSMAGQQMGDKDPRGALFWTTLEIIAHVLKCNPNAKYMMENVKMKADFEQYITYHTNQALGHTTIKTLINSALLSAQNRQRYYWTNFPVWQPQDRGFILRDVLEGGDTVPKHVRTGVYEYDGGDIVATEINRIGTATDINGHDLLKRVYSDGGKAPTLTASSGGNQEPKVSCSEDFTVYRRLTPLECERLQTFPDNWTAGLSNTQRYKTIGNAWTVDVIAHIIFCMVYCDQGDYDHE